MADLDLDPGVLGAERGEHPGEVDRSHPLRLHRPEHDRSAQPAAGLVDGVSCRLRGRQRRARLRAAARGRRRSASTL